MINAARALPADAAPASPAADDESQPVLTVVSDDRPDDRLSVEELGSRIVGLAGRIAAASCRWLLLVADFDGREGFRHFGLGSTARWLSHYCGLSARTARDHVRVARTLAAHPALAAAMRAGRLSYSHARAISRVAELGDERLVADLVVVAEHGTIGQLEELVRGLRHVDENQRDSATAERLTHWWRTDGYFALSTRLDPEHGALLLAAIETVAAREGLTQPQALARLAEIALAASSGDAPAPSLRGDEYAAVVVHLTAAPRSTDAEPAGSREPSQRPAGRIPRGPGLPDAVVRRLLCAGRIRTVVWTDSADRHARSPLDVGRSHRLVGGRQFRALLLRDGGCAHPGCGSRVGLEAHHVRHWVDGGATDLANLVLLCRRHHHAHHDGEFGIRGLGKGRFEFVRSDGRRLPPHADPGALAPTDAPIEADHADVPDDAATTRWDGSRLDREYATWALAQRLHTTAARREHAA